MSRAGSIRKEPNGLWLFVVDPAPLGAPRRQVRRRGFRTRREAQQALDRLKADVDRGEFVERSRKTVGEYLERWLPAIRGTIEPSTWESYERNVRNHLLPALGDIRLQALTPDDLSDLYAALAASGRRDGRGGLSARTVQYCHVILHRALSDAVRRGYVVRNVSDYALVPAPKRVRRSAEMATWAADEVATFLEVTRFDRLYVVWYVALMTGMRRGEVLGLRWRDCDLEAGRVRLVRQLRVVRHVPEFSDLKTDRSRRQVGLDPRTATLLRQHRTTQIEERLMVGDGYQDGDLVFAMPDGAHYHPEAVSKVFDRRVARWGMPHITFHDTRHTWATLALQAGVHPKVVSDRLGHASVAFTLDVYSHAIQGLDDDAAARVAELVHRGTGVRPGS
jgi:integrase